MKIPSGSSEAPLQDYEEKSRKGSGFVMWWLSFDVPFDGLEVNPQTLKKNIASAVCLALDHPLLVVALLFSCACVSERWLLQK